MKRRPRNLAAFVFFHILVLSYPLMEKAFHEHEKGYRCSYSSEPCSLVQSLKDCPVCDFEFYSFIGASFSEVVAELTGIPVYNSPAPVSRDLEQINYFSLRAPPSCI